MRVDGLDGAVLDGLAQHGAGDGADDLELFNETGCGDVLAELGDTGEDLVVGGTIEEDCVIGFFFDLSLGPLLGTARLLGGCLRNRFLGFLGACCCLGHW